MTRLIDLFNLALTKAFSLLLFPVAGLKPVWAMAAVSLVAGIIMLLIFGKVSNQEAIRRVRDQIRGNLIAVRLYQDDIGILLRLQARIMGFTLKYMRYSLVPMLVMMIPVTLLLIQLNLRFSARPLKPGENAVVKVKTREGVSIWDLALTAPDGVVLEAPPVHVEEERATSWRIRADIPGRYELAFRIGDQTIQKKLVVMDRWGSASGLRTGKSAWEMLLYPGEPGIPPAAGVESVQLQYPELKMPMFGWNVPWLVQFFVLSIVFGFAFKGVFKVEV